MSAAGQVVRLALVFLRAYRRDRGALFFSFLLPLMFLLIFGALDLGGFGRVALGIADEARNDDSARLVAALGRAAVVSVSEGDAATERAALARGARDLVVVVPAGFTLAPAAGATPAALDVVLNAGRPAQAGVGRAIVTAALAEATRAPAVVALRFESVSANDLRYVDLLVPGILAMTIMQLGISGVAYGLVGDKQRGVLRRFLATPLPLGRLLAAQVLQRLVVALVQTAILLGVAVLLFHVRVVGSLAGLFAVALLGAVLFFSLGYAIAGWATSLDQVGPLTQLVTLPQLMLAGVFFSADAIPALVRPVTALLPLTLLADALRGVATAGAGAGDLTGPLAGLAVWTALSFALAVRLFRVDATA